MSCNFFFALLFWGLLLLPLLQFGIYTDLVYLDHAGATLYSELQMESVFKDLTSNVYGNPRILMCD